MAVFGLVGTVLALAAVGGLVQLVLAGISGLALIQLGLVKGLGLVWRMTTLTWTVGAAALGILRGAFMGAMVAAKLFAIILMANPLGLVVAAIALVVGALAAVVYHWDWVKEKAGAAIDALIDGWQAVAGWFSRIDLLSGIRAGFAGLFDQWSALRTAFANNRFLAFVFTPLWVGVEVVAVLVNQFQRVIDWFATFKGWLADADIFAGVKAGLSWVLSRWSALRERLESNQFLAFVFTPLLAGADAVTVLFKQLQAIPDWFTDLKRWLDDLTLFEALGGAADWLIEKLNRLPGIDIGGSLQVSDTLANQKARVRVGTGELPQFQPSAVPNRRYFPTGGQPAAPWPLH